MNVFGQNRYTIIGILTIISFAMLPIYLFSSGGFQLVDVIIILLSLAIFMAVNFYEAQVGIYLISPFIPFLSWSIIVNSYYSMETISGAGYFRSSIQLIFGFYILFLFTIVFCRILSNPKGVSYLYWSLLICCITPWLLKAKGGVMRNSLSFNNPNQLAYYAILILSMLLLINSINTEMQNKKIMHWILNIIILIFANVFSAVSASRVGIVAVILLDTYFFYTLFREYKKLFLLLAFILPVIAIVLMQYKSMQNRNMKFSNDEASFKYIQTAQERFKKHNIFENLQKRILGHIGDKSNISIILGSGANKGWLEESRVGTMSDGQEAHNAIMEIYDSYGVIGIVLFLGGSIFYITRLGSFPYKWFFFFILLLYNASHNGIRFRSMWVAVALISVISIVSNKSKTTSIHTYQNYSL